MVAVDTQKALGGINALLLAAHDDKAEKKHKKEKQKEDKKEKKKDKKEKKQQHSSD